MTMRAGRRWFVPLIIVVRVLIGGDEPVTVGAAFGPPSASKVGIHGKHLTISGGFDGKIDRERRSPRLRPGRVADCYS
jgi:hypothetical protein